jgi:hypothetical protein
MHTCRYEDLAGAAVKRAEELYRRLDAPMPPSVRAAMIKNDECARATRYKVQPLEHVYCTLLNMHTATCCSVMLVSEVAGFEQH